MFALVLDTTVLIDALRGRPAAARLRNLAARHEVLLTTAVTAGIGAHLATGNTKHFPMPEVTVEEWPPGI